MIFNKNLCSLTECVEVMENFSSPLCPGILFWFLVLIGVAHLQQTCPPPDVPRYGNYLPTQKIFQPGDTVTYNCMEGFTLIGKETSKCKTNGDWTNPTPFCDRQARIKNAYALDIRHNHLTNLQITDGNISTCFTISTDDSIELVLNKPGSAYVVRIFIKKSSANIFVLNGAETCSNYGRPVDTGQWISIHCDTNEALSNVIKIQARYHKKNNSTICEVEVYAKEEEGCDKPPDRKVADGHFEVSRSLATLICDEGYQTANNNSDRLVCEKNVWVGSRLQCEEILCDPVLKIPVTPGSRWNFVDPVRKISAGTRRTLECNNGYTISGSPDKIVCQKNGLWTETNATCIGNPYTKTIIFGSVGVFVILLVIALFAATIHIVRKQRREVVVLYKHPAEGSATSGSENEYSGFYETIQINTPQPQPQPPTSARPKAQLLSEAYFTPVDRIDNPERQRLPADLAFDYAVPYHHHV